MKYDHDTGQDVFAELESKGQVIKDKYVCTCINYPLLTRDLVSAGRAATDNEYLLKLLDEQLDREREAKSVCYRKGEAILLVNGTDEAKLKRMICKEIENELKALKRVGRYNVSDEDKERVREALSEWRRRSIVLRKRSNRRKQKTEFVDRINKKTEAERMEVLEKLRKVVYKDRYQGKGMALLIMCLHKEDGLTSPPKFPELVRAFNGTNIGNAKGYSNYKNLGWKSYTSIEIDDMIRVVKNALK